MCFRKVDNFQFLLHSSEASVDSSPDSVLSYNSLTADLIQLPRTSSAQNRLCFLFPFPVHSASFYEYDNNPVAIRSRKIQVQVFGSVLVPFLAMNVCHETSD